MGMRMGGDGVGWKWIVESVLVLWCGSWCLNCGVAPVLRGKKQLVFLPKLLCAVCFLCLFLMVLFAVLLSVIVTFPSHTHLIFQREI